jgi:glycosyltransferase involved in cell wall biosynthesis
VNKRENNNFVTLLGGPFSPIGMGEHIRCTYRALREVALKPSILNLDLTPTYDAALEREYSSVCTSSIGAINIFHINGNNVDEVMNHFDVRREFHKKYNIIYPAWELERYPTEWAEKLDYFDEIWAPSMFIKNSIEKVCNKPVLHMPLACEVILNEYRSRRYFGIPESDYVFLFFFDIRSYYTRKNPKGILSCFKEIFSSKTHPQARLVIKINGAELSHELVQQLKEELCSLSPKVNFFPQVMTDNEIKNLIRCSDCFISLHRSEGFGRGMAEAMALGKPVIATGYSGNLDFMNSEIAYLLDYILIPVKEGEYPHYENQVWAEPNLSQAVLHIQSLLEKPEEGRKKGAAAKRHMGAKFSYNSIGLNYLERIESLYYTQ